MAVSCVDAHEHPEEHGQRGKSFLCFWRCYRQEWSGAASHMLGTASATHFFCSAAQRSSSALVGCWPCKSSSAQTAHCCLSSCSSITHCSHPPHPTCLHRVLMRGQEGIIQPQFAALAHHQKGLQEDQRPGSAHEQPSHLRVCIIQVPDRAHSAIEIPCLTHFALGHGLHGTFGARAPAHAANQQVSMTQAQVIARLDKLA